MNKLTDSKEETILKELVRFPIGYDYVEQGKTFYEVRDKDGESFRIQVKKVVKKKSKNRPKGRVPGMEDLI